MLVRNSKNKLKFSDQKPHFRNYSLGRNSELYGINNHQIFHLESSGPQNNPAPCLVIKVVLTKMGNMS